MNNKHNRTDAEWQAVWDAETLAQAELIKGDKARLELAIKAAKDLKNEEKAQSEAMDRVSNMKA